MKMHVRGIKNLYRSEIGVQKLDVLEKQQPEHLTAFCRSHMIELQIPTVTILRIFPLLSPSQKDLSLTLDNELSFKGQADLQTHFTQCVVYMSASSSCLRPLTPVCRCASRFIPGCCRHGELC